MQYVACPSDWVFNSDAFYCAGGLGSIVTDPVGLSILQPELIASTFGAGFGLILVSFAAGRGVGLILDVIRS